MGNPRIQYNSINIDFDRGFNVFRPHIVDKRSTNEASSGVSEHLHFYGREYIEAGFKRLQNHFIMQLREWYRYVRDGSAFKLWLDRDRGAYVAFEGESLKTANEVSHTAFARTSSNDHRINPYTGLVENIAAGSPRYETGKFGLALRVEGAQTNLCAESEDFSTTWTASSITVSADTSDILDPSGGTDADKLTASAANGTLSYDTSTAITDTSGTFSVYLRAQSGGTDNVIIELLDTAGTSLATESLSVNPSWTRYEVTYVSSGSISNNWRFRIKIVNNADVIYGWGAQFETRTFASSYISTDGSTANRNAETVYWPITSGEDIGRLKGTIAFWFKPPWNFFEEPEDMPVRTFLMVRDSGNNRCLEIYRDTDTKIKAKFEDADSNTMIAQAATGNLVQNDWNLCVLMYDLTAAAASVNWYINGVESYNQNWLADHDGLPIYDADDNVIYLERTEFSENSILPNKPDHFYLGNDSSGSQPSDCLIDSVLFDLDVKSSNWAAKHYAQAHDFGYRRNYWSSVELVDAEFTPELLTGGNVYNFEFTAREVLT